MTNQDWIRRRGIFLHYPGPAQINMLANTLPQIDLQPLWGDIKSVPTTETITLNLIPIHLREACESWLLLYQDNMPNEVLIIPFPTSNVMPLTEKQNSLYAFLHDLFTIVAETKDNSWHPSTGYINLKRKLRSINKTLSSHPYPESFELLRTLKPFQTYLHPPQVKNMSVISHGGTLILQRLTERIQQHRTALLEALLDENTPRTEAIATFEAGVLHESALIAEEITRHYDCPEVIPSIIHQHPNLLDEQTKRFLITGATIAQFAKQHQPPHFDYAAAGCGLWKAVERELNLSFIWHLRRRRGIAGDDPLQVMVGKDTAPVTINGVKLRIEDRDNPGYYKGIMLGEITNLLNQAQSQGITSEVQGVLDHQCTNLLLDDSQYGLQFSIHEVKPIRNRYAHIAAMPVEEYEKLAFLVLSRNDGAVPLLKKVLSIKHSIRDFWSSKSVIEQ